MIPLSDTAMRRMGFGVIAVAMALAAIYVAMSISAGAIGDAAEMIILASAFGGVTAVSVRAVPRNGAVWALIWAAFFGVASQLGSRIGMSRTGFTGAMIEAGQVTVAPGDIDGLAAGALAISLSFWVPAAFLLANHLLILFPGGSAVSTTWRRVAWVSGLCMAAMVIPTLLGTAPWVATPYSVIYGNEMGPAGVLSMLMLVPMAVALAALVSLIRRFRKSSGEERLQYRWVTLGVSLQVVTIFFFGLAPEPIGTVALAAIPISFGIAITKYRLFDIDLVISKTLVFVGLAGFITAVYAGVVVGIGSLFEGTSVSLSVAAIALVAVVFEPFRDRLQRWVNRLVYGQRATPYEVLSDLTGRLAVAEMGEGLLDRMALRLAEGTGAERAVVWVAGIDGLGAAACQPASARPSEAVAGLAEIQGAVVPITRGDDVLGALSVEKPRGDGLNPTETRLIEDLAASAALFLARRRLDAELEEKARQLADSRRRLLSAHDVERRRLEQQLNEGAQQLVLALKLQLGLASQLAAREGSDRTAAMVTQMADEAQHAIDQIRALAYGIYPPLLEAEGLSAAVSALADLTPMGVRVDTNILGRHPLPTEAAVYFAISEAITNATKHATGPLSVRVSDADDALTFQVSDFGPGFDLDNVERGSGLTNMTDRLDALGGTLLIDSKPGGRTTIAGTLSVRTSAGV